MSSSTVLPEYPEGAPSIKHLMERVPGDGQFFSVQGNPAFVIMPKQKPADGGETPWVWYAPVVGGVPGARHIWLFTKFLEAGIAIAGVDVGESMGNPRGRAIYTALYGQVRKDHGLSDRACLLPQSRGGLMLYNWAVEDDHPQHIACIAGIYTVCNFSSWPGVEAACEAYGMSRGELAAQLPKHNPIDRIASLAKARVPILHIHGDQDTVVPLESHSGELAKRYRELGGEAKVIVIKGKGHEEVPEFFLCQDFADFVIQHARPERRMP